MCLLMMVSMMSRSKRDYSDCCCGWYPCCRQVCGTILIVVVDGIHVVDKYVGQFCLLLWMVSILSTSMWDNSDCCCGWYPSCRQVCGTILSVVVDGIHVEDKYVGQFCLLLWMVSILSTSMRDNSVCCCGWYPCCRQVCGTILIVVVDGIHLADKYVGQFCLLLWMVSMLKTSMWDNSVCCCGWYPSCRQVCGTILSVVVDGIHVEDKYVGQFCLLLWMVSILSTSMRDNSVCCCGWYPCCRQVCGTIPSVVVDGIHVDDKYVGQFCLLLWMVSILSTSMWDNSVCCCEWYPCYRQVCGTILIVVVDNVHIVGVSGYY